jgi:thiol-disulfide isomerase/thioredoxin
MNLIRRRLLTSSSCLLSLPSLAHAKALTRAQEQRAAVQAAQLVADATGEKPHRAAGMLLSLPGEIRLLGQPTKTRQQFEKKVVLLYFWASWCPICKVLGPRLQEFWQANQSKGIALLGVASQESIQKTVAAIEQRKYQFPVAAASALNLGAAFQPRNLPTLMVRSKLGVIVTIEEGDVSAEELNELLIHL